MKNTRCREGEEPQPLGDCWIDAMMRKKYCEVTEDIEKRVEEKEGTIGAQWRRFLDIEDVSEEEQDTAPLQRQRNR